MPVGLNCRRFCLKKLTQEEYDELSEEEQREVKAD